MVGGSGGWWQVMAPVAVVKKLQFFLVPNELKAQKSYMFLHDRGLGKTQMWKISYLLTPP